MSKYYSKINNNTSICKSSGSALSVSKEFFQICGELISKCSFAQDMIQQIIYTSHESEISDARHSLKSFPSPKSRFDFLCSFNYKSADPVIKKVFDFSRDLFIDLYDLRNVIAHEIWSSSDDYPNAVLFSSLDENARLQMASSRLWHKTEATSQETFNAIIRYIRSMKVLTIDNAILAIEDIDLCGWCLITINNVLTEHDPVRKEQARKAFFVFKGTSHLFSSDLIGSEIIEYNSRRSKSITW